MNSLSRNWPQVLLAVYLIEFGILGIAPLERITWVTENSIVLLTVTTLVIMYWCKVRFSNTAYTLMAIFLYLHTIGGHYTFAKVPFDFVTELFGFERNHFDRMCHFLVGVFAFPVLEWCDKKAVFRFRSAAAFFVIMAVFGFAAIFELVEWIYAELADPESGAAFLGSQGDIWDAQKDMLSDGLGAMATTIFYGILRWRGK